MLKRLDRIQIAVTDRAAAERVVAQVLGGEVASRDAVPALGAKRTAMQAGESFIELL